MYPPINDEDVAASHLSFQGGITFWTSYHVFFSSFPLHPSHHPVQHQWSVHPQHLHLREENWLRKTTLPETNSKSPWKLAIQKVNSIFQPPVFRCKLAVSFRECRLKNDLCKKKTLPNRCWCWIHDLPRSREPNLVMMPCCPFWVYCSSPSTFRRRQLVLRLTLRL